MDRPNPLGRRPGHATDTIHVDARELLSENVDLATECWREPLKCAHEALGASDLDTLELALGDNFVDHAMINLDEEITVKGRAELLFEQREDPRDSGVNLVAVHLHQRQPLGLPLNDGIEQIKDD